jgi:hypothetical protein
MQGNCCVIRGGTVHIGAYQAPSWITGTTPLRPLYPANNRFLGEVSMAELTVSEDKKERQSHRNPIGGLACSLTRIKGAELKMKVDCSSADNNALVLLGLNRSVATGVVVSEPAIVYKPAAGASRVLLRPQYLIDTSVVPTLTGVGGTPALVYGTDYVIEYGHIYILPTSTIAAPTNASTPNVEINYTRRNQQQVQSAMSSGGIYTLQFAGFEVGSGATDAYSAGVRYARIQPSGINLINDDFDEVEMNFELLPDPALIGNPDFSPYFEGYFAAT